MYNILRFGNAVLPSGGHLLWSHVMNTAEGNGKVEVTSVAVGVRVFAQRPVELRDSTIVESAQVVDENSQPQSGGVQQLAPLLDSDSCISREILATSVQQSTSKVDNLAETGGAFGCGQQLVTYASQRAARQHSAAELLDLPPQTKLGRPGRKPVVTPELAEQLCMLLSIGFSRRQAAAYLGISPMSITNAVTRDPALGEELRQAEELQTLQPELTIMAEARRNWRAAAWYLNFKAKQPRSAAEISEAEKEELHQARLADQRRESELLRQSMLNMHAGINAAQEADLAAKGRQRKLVH